MLKSTRIPIMSEKFKKAGRSYVLSDSSVNEYGFRLLTSGYQIESFRKNPIGYYMHRREDGIVLKWDDLQVEGDQLVGTPVINLAHPRGAQTFDEAENGFLNAASVGHIVVLEYSTDPEMMLPGQTGATITKWYNKECSLVDIPGNGNALTRLYDVNENEINLVDLGIAHTSFKLPAGLHTQLCHCLSIDEGSSEDTMLAAVTSVLEKTRTLETANSYLQSAHQGLQTELAELKKSQAAQEVGALLERALEDRKITVELKTRLTADYASNAEGLRTLLTAMPAYRSIAEHLAGRKQDDTEAQWSWDDYEKNDPTGGKLKNLRANDPVRYKELFDKKFAA